MKLSDVVAGAGLAAYAEIALILFLLAFVAVCVAILWPRQDRRFDAASRLPLDDDPTARPTSGDR